jgi:hypothetical protein
VEASQQALPRRGRRPGRSHIAGSAYIGNAGDGGPGQRFLGGKAVGDFFRFRVQDGAIYVQKSVGLAGENLEYAHHFVSRAHRNANHGANAQGAANLAIDTRICFAVVTTKQSAGTQAGAGKAGARINARPQRRRDAAGGAAAQLAIFSQRDAHSVAAG